MKFPIASIKDERGDFLPQRGDLFFGKVLLNNSAGCPSSPEAGASQF